LACPGVLVAARASAAAIKVSLTSFFSLIVKQTHAQGRVDPRSNRAAIEFVFGFFIFRRSQRVFLVGWATSIGSIACSPAVVNGFLNRELREWEGTRSQIAGFCYGRDYKSRPSKVGVTVAVSPCLRTSRRGQASYRVLRPHASTSGQTASRRIRSFCCSR